MTEHEVLIVDGIQTENRNLSTEITRLKKLVEKGYKEGYKEGFYEGDYEGLESNLNWNDSGVKMEMEA